jgi:hypothetical protein
MVRLFEPSVDGTWPAAAASPAATAPAAVAVVATQFEPTPRDAPQRIARSKHELRSLGGGSTTGSTGIVAFGGCGLRRR